MAYEDTESLGYPTIRHSECELLVPHTTSKCRCSKCTKYRKTLRALVSRQSHSEQQAGCDYSKTGAESHVNCRFLTVNEKDERLRELHTQHRNTTKRLRRLEEKLSFAIEQKGISVDESVHSDLKQIMQECSAKVTSEYPEAYLLGATVEGRFL